MLHTIYGRLNKPKNFLKRTSEYKVSHLTNEKKFHYSQTLCSNLATLQLAT